MNIRQRDIFKAVVEEYIVSGEPVSSGFLADHYGRWHISPATIRNELMALVSEGFLEQPHTSAGRIPTVQGYRYFVDHLLEQEPIDQEEQEMLEAVQGMGELSEILARTAHSLVMGCQDPREVYEAGLSYLLEEPEFTDREFLVDFVKHAEAMRKEFMKLREVADGKPHLFIGEEAEGLIGDSRYSFVVTPVKGEGFAVFFSSTRMRYPKILSLANFLSETRHE